MVCEFVLLLGGEVSYQPPTLTPFLLLMQHFCWGGWDGNGNQGVGQCDRDFVKVLFQGSQCINQLDTTGPQDGNAVGDTFDFGDLVA